MEGLTHFPPIKCPSTELIALISQDNASSWKFSSNISYPDLMFSVFTCFTECYSQIMTGPFRNTNTAFALGVCLFVSNLCQPK